MEGNLALVSLSHVDNERQAWQRKEPWRERCTYVSPTGSKCESVTPRNWTHCPNHTFKLGELLDETTGTVVRELELPALGKPLGSLNSAEYEALRLRLIRTQPQVQL